jgi:hypothetical protein
MKDKRLMKLAGLLKENEEVFNPFEEMPTTSFLNQIQGFEEAIRVCGWSASTGVDLVLNDNYSSEQDDIELSQAEETIKAEIERRPGLEVEMLKARLESHWEDTIHIRTTPAAPEEYKSFKVEIVKTLEE